MNANTEQVLNQALELPPIERAELIERLLSSFNFPSRKDIDTLWEEEVESRIDAFDRGELKARSSSRVFKDIDQ